MKFIPWGLVLALLLSNALTAVVQTSWRRAVEHDLENCRRIEGDEFADLHRCKNSLETSMAIQATVTRAIEDHLRIHNRPGGWCSPTP